MLLVCYNKLTAGEDDFGREHITASDPHQTRGNAYAPTQKVRDHTYCISVSNRFSALAASCILYG